MKEEVYDHFTPLERPFIARVTDWITVVQSRRQVVKTDFLDPRQVYILQTLIAAELDVQVDLDGGFPEAERQRAIVYPDFLRREAVRQEIGLALLEATWIGESKALRHGDFLGSLLNIGLKRNKFGDLWKVERGVQVVVADEVLDYILLHWTHVGRHALHVEQIGWKRLSPPSAEVEERVVSLSSTRLDAFVSELCHLSRNKAVTLIQGQKVKVNWKVEVDQKRRLEEGDTLSVKGYGRFQVLARLGSSKRGKLRVQVGQFQ